MHIIAIGFEHPLDVSVERSIYAHLSEQHWAPIFCSIDQQMNREPPFPHVAF